MPADTIPYARTGYFSELICDYLAHKEALRPFFHRFPEPGQFTAQAREKADTFDRGKRDLLVSRLKEQNRGIQLSPATRDNIDKLAESDCFTVTTGHQLNLFTGPLYFFYKILTTINLAEALNKENTAFHTVPVFWMATEDHDLEEINFFNFRGEKVRWERDAGGAVGRMSTDGLEAVARQLEGKFGESGHARALIQLFKAAYLEHDNLAQATRYLVNELFGTYGLVILDGDDAELKKVFVPVARKELEGRVAFEQIEASTNALESAGYPKQVHPREINLFCLTTEGRHRIIRDGDSFILDGSQHTLTTGEMWEILENEPDRISPNAVLRPLYQEMVLPNLCYTGGGGELAYWFQLKDCFLKFGQTFPILMLRNSLLMTTDKQLRKLDKLGRSVRELFLPSNELEDKHCREISDIEIDLSPQRAYLREQFEGLYDLAKKTDASFLGAVAAQEKKQLKGLDKLEKRLLKAQKRKLADQLSRLTDIQDQLFPKGGLQERHNNFSEFYLEYGPGMVGRLKEEIRPWRLEFGLGCW